MIKEEWEELRQIGLKTKGVLKGRGATLLEMTMEEDEHPEDYDGPRMCRLCCSYGD